MRKYYLKRKGQIMFTCDNFDRLLRFIRRTNCTDCVILDEHGNDITTRVLAVN